MRIEIHTSNAMGLLAEMKKDITEKKIKTWSIVQDDKKVEYFTHNPEQWFKKALLEPSAATHPSRLILTITWFTISVPTEYIKGLYIGRFTEELLEHYRSRFNKLETFA